jgi:hypothetical protein
MSAPDEPQPIVPKNLGRIVQTALVQMDQNGLTYGSYFPMGELKKLAETMGGNETDFAFFKMALGAALRERGYWFTCDGLRGEGYRIAQRVENAHYIERTMREAQNDLARGITLGANTDFTGLTDAERRRHENLLAQARHQRLMLLRAEEATTVIRKHKPGLLREDVMVTASAEPQN